MTHMHSWPGRGQRSLSCMVVLLLLLLLVEVVAVVVIDDTFTALK